MKFKLPITLIAILALGGGLALYILRSGHASASESTSTEQAREEHHEHESLTDQKTSIPAEVAKREGIVTAIAGPVTIQETVSVYGSVKLNSDHIARAVPRFGGMVLKASKGLGDTVAAGEVVAQVETNQSLTSIEVKAPISGVVIDRDVNIGETIADGTALYTIADLSDVWVDLNVPKRDQGRIRVGQHVTIHADDGGVDAEGVLSWISPISSPEAQTLIARVVLQNTGQRWRPGLYVKAEITLSEQTVPVGIKEAALQTMEENRVVFSVEGDLYRIRPLKLGRRGAGWVEVLEGLRPGESYVIENSFLIKADIGKAGAAHAD
jgi:cobalt-zinc-cadmium efflux system membrane fusion protein